MARVEQYVNRGIGLDPCELKSRDVNVLVPIACHIAFYFFFFFLP